MSCPVRFSKALEHTFALEQGMTNEGVLVPVAPRVDQDGTLSVPMDDTLTDESDDEAEHSQAEERYIIELEGLEPLAEGAEPRRGVSKLGIGKKSWTVAEDDILGEIVAKNGAQRWSSVAAHLPGRAGKQCRERCAV